MLKPTVLDSHFTFATKTFFFEPQTDGVVSKSPSITVDVPSVNFLLGVRYPTIKLLAVVHSGAGKELARGLFVVRRNARGSGVNVTVEGFADVPGTASVRIAQIAAAFGDELGVLARTIKDACDKTIAATYAVQNAEFDLVQAQEMLSDKRLALKRESTRLAELGVRIVEVDG